MFLVSVSAPAVAVLRRTPDSELYSDTERNRTRQALRGGLSEERVRQIVDHVCEVHPVEEVEDLTSQLQGSAFLDKPRDARGLDHVQVDVGQARSVEGVAAEVALLAGGWERKCRSREQSVDEVAPGGRNRVAERRSVRRVLVEAVRVEVAPRIGRRAYDGKRQAALEDGDSGELPSAQDLLSHTLFEQGRDLVDAVDGEPARDVEIGPAVLADWVRGVDDVLRRRRPRCRYSTSGRWPCRSCRCPWPRILCRSVC